MPWSGAAQSSMVRVSKMLGGYIHLQVSCSSVMQLSYEEILTGSFRREEGQNCGSG